MENGGWWVVDREGEGGSGGGGYMLGDGWSETMGLFLVWRTKGLGIGFLVVCLGGSTLWTNVVATEEDRKLCVYVMDGYSGCRH